MPKAPKKNSLDLPTKNTKADDKVKGGVTRLPLGTAVKGSNTIALGCKATGTVCA